MEMQANIRLLYFVKNEVVYFDSFGVEYIPEEIKKFIGNKDIEADIFEYKKTNQYCVGTFAQDLLIFVSR